jgi:hypothetical protein
LEAGRVERGLCRDADSAVGFTGTGGVTTSSMPRMWKHWPAGLAHRNAGGCEDSAYIGVVAEVASGDE